MSFKIMRNDKNEKVIHRPSTEEMVIDIVFIL